MVAGNRLLIAVGLAWVLMPRQGVAANWPSVEMPDGMEVASVATRMVFNGSDLRSQVFRSTLPSDRLLAWYAREWGGKSVLNDVAGWQVIGHKVGEYYVTVQVQSDGAGSRGDIGIVRIPPPGTRPRPVGEGFARPSDTVVLNDIIYPDDAVPARTLAMANRLSPAQNAAWYRDRMASEGWKPAQRNDCADGAAGCMLAYERGGARLVIAMTSDDGQSSKSADTILASVARAAAKLT
ncbi:hypothetical protein [Frateuria defendens]|uniref:hypothetical protein n=1 Tax=Frateuria defendens TaxID=2219559 RepID=UPI00066FDD37|nr:hypothetical protein [Frateuria defendens]